LRFVIEVKRNTGEKKWVKAFGLSPQKGIKSHIKKNGKDNLHAKKK